MRTLLLLALPATALAGGPMLDVTGACPGPIDITISGLTPGASIGLLAGLGEGSDPLGVGPCADTLTGLDRVNPLLTRRDGDRDGTITLRPTVSPSACGRFVQAIELEACTTTNVEVVGEGDEGTCRTVAGIRWCYHPTECGRACDDTCSALGWSTMADSGRWFEAQNTPEECQVIADAFGHFEAVNFGGYSYACMEDSYGDHPSPAPIGALFCSSDASCPDAHRGTMDQIGVACGPDSRKAICPCE
ncbi:MAG: hypothetical protein ACI8PZ_006054 [Myxococcota bacterium]